MESRIWKVYTNNNSRLLLVGLIDLYESVYFVYYFKDGVLARLGQIDIEQPENVEEEGAKKVSFKVEEENKKMIVKSYLDGAYAHTSEFLLKSIPGTENKWRNQKWKGAYTDGLEEGVFYYYEADWVVEQEEIDDFDKYLHEHRPELEGLKW